MPGTDHSEDDGCFVALKQFVKLCQDEIESSRMSSYERPTREELTQALIEMEEQFNKLAFYSDTLAHHIQEVLHAKL